MKIQIASDLHQEWIQSVFKDAPALTPAPDADVLVLAGDIHARLGGLQSFADWPVPVVYVAGNHEAYGEQLHGLIDALKDQAKTYRIHFLELTEARIDGVRFLGSTMWTDYELNGAAHAPRAMSLAEHNMRDHRIIYAEPGLFDAKKARDRHLASRAWLGAHLSTPFEGKTVVVTHHGPHPGGVARQFMGDPLNAAFFSDLRPLMTNVDLWVHGHTHSPVDILEGRCRVLANPRGYPLNLRQAASPAELTFENRAFQPHLVIEI